MSIAASASERSVRTGGRPPVALVHDYLTQRGGAERVALALAHAFPDAVLHTSVYNPGSTFPELADVRVAPGALNRVPAFRGDPRRALPLLAPAFSRRRIDADVVVCSSSGWAHGIQTDGRKVVYCHTPARWLHQTERYLSQSGRAVGLALAAMKPWLLEWDRRAAHSADAYIVNSHAVRTRVKEVYGLDAIVIPPPHAADPNGPKEDVAGVQPGYYLVVSRLLPYKNVDAVVKAFEERPDLRLVVVGTGPEERRLQAMAAGNVQFVGTVSDDRLRWLYAHCRALIAVSYEDFGLTPLEAAAFGKPTLALRFGGYLDTIHPGRTGLFIDTPTADAVADGLTELSTLTMAPEQLESHAAAFSESAFIRRLHGVVGAG